MAQKDDLSRFVREGLANGHTRTDLRDVLVAAGWSPAEIGDALEAWADIRHSPPVPKPRNIVSARDFFVYALIFAAMLAGAINLVIVMHAIIDFMYDDDFRSGIIRSIRWGGSVLMVTAPVYFWLTWREGRRLRADPGLYRSSIRKWVTYLTLLLAALVFGGDMIAAIYALLNGDLTGQFALKAASVAAVSGGIFLFYLKETEPKS